MDDVFGLALQDHLDGKTAGTISVRRDDGFVDTHDAGLYFAAEPQAHEASVLKAVAGPVLDIGCGAGRHVLWLQAAGVDVAGLDISPGAVQVCRRRGCQRHCWGGVGRSIRWIRGRLPHRNRTSLCNTHCLGPACAGAGRRERGQALWVG